jgi:hypothetical protein
MSVDHWEALFDHTYLRWFDLNGQPSLCEIVNVQARVELTLPGGAKSRKPVITLKQVQGKIENARDDNGKELPSIKPLVLNVTNGSVIADICGDEPSAWKGKRIVLYLDKTKMWNAELRKIVESDCIRVRAPKAEKQSTTGETNEHANN